MSFKLGKFASNSRLGCEIKYYVNINLYTQKLISFNDYWFAAP